MKKITTDKVKNMLVFLLVFVFIFAFAYMVPYTHDDWAWGCDIGFRRLHDHFKNYNGRYLGNLLVIALTRSNILKALVMSGTVASILYFIYRTTSKKDIKVFLFSAIALFAVPRSIFRQTLAWTSGFTNYVVPTLLLIIYIYIIKSVFEKSPDFKKTTFVVTFVVGICASLFMENITIYQILIDIMLLLFITKKHQKIFTPVITHFLGSLSGCIIMFSNGAYRNIAEANDDYRTMPLMADNLFLRMRDNLFFIIRKETALNNVILNIIIAVLCIVLVYSFLNKKNNISPIKKRIVQIGLIITVTYAVYSLCMAIYPNWRILDALTVHFDSLFLLLYIISLVTLSVICVDKKEISYRLCFYIISIVLLTLPLFVVTPVSSRCFFCGYVFFVLFACELFSYLFNGSNQVKKNDIFFKPLVVLCVCIAVFYSSVFGMIYKCEIKRNVHVKDQISDGKTVVVLSELPYQNYLWGSTPNPETMWGDRYKAFYGIDQKTELKIIKHHPKEVKPKAEGLPK
ncbi:MAG: DUF6056 family protein [Oscillospiraceae bacterium]|nr:DUF6056 family protein [Oscillospiraceae bacterium]